MTHTSEHESVLIACLEDCDPRKAWNASPVSDCADCGRQLDELLEIRRELHAVGDDFRGAISQPVPLEEALVERVLGPEVRAAARTRPVALLAVVAAAAAALLIFFVLTREERRAATMLGAPGLVLLPPAAGTTTFSWNGVLPEGGWFEIHVLTMDGEILTRASTQETRWTPKSTAEWPAEVRWQVASYDASGALVEQVESSLSLPAR